MHTWGKSSRHIRLLQTYGDKDLTGTNKMISIFWGKGEEQNSSSLAGYQFIDDSE